MTWRKRIDVARLSVVKAGKGSAAIMHKVAAQGLERANLTGAKLARRIVAVQKSAGATDKMIRESARSVANRPMTRESDRAWQAAYVAEAGKQIAGVQADAPDRNVLTYRTGSWDFGPSEDREASA